MMSKDERRFWLKIGLLFALMTMGLGGFIVACEYRPSIAPPRPGETWLYLVKDDPFCVKTRYEILETKDGFVRLRFPGASYDRSIEMEYFIGKFPQWHRDPRQCSAKLGEGGERG